MRIKVTNLLNFLSKVIYVESFEHYLDAEIHIQFGLTILKTE